jgi:hypothetical protein
LFRHPLTRYLLEQIEPFAGYRRLEGEKPGDVVWMRQVRNETERPDRTPRCRSLSLTAFEAKRSFGGFTRLAYRPYSQTARWKVVSSLHCMNDPRPEGHMASYVGRRKFLATLGGAAAAWPLAARAQQTVTPVVGFIRDGSADASTRYVAAFRKGLSEAGYVEGQNVTVEYHWLEGQQDRLPALLAGLVRHRVAALVTPGNVPTLAAKAATTPLKWTTDVRAGLTNEAGRRAQYQLPRRGGIKPAFTG